MPFNNVRNYLAEKIAHLRNEWKLFQSHQADPKATLEATQDTDTRRHFFRIYSENTDEAAQLALNAEYSTIVEAIRIDFQSRDQPFELRRLRPPSKLIPENRLPAPGLALSPHEYHTGHIIHANPFTSKLLDPDLDTDAYESYIPGDTDYGPDIDPMIRQLIIRKYPQYLKYISKYCRPAGTTDGTFHDFNKEQIPSAPIDPDRKEHVLKHVFSFLDVTPYLPIHFVDTQYDKRPLVTGTGYHNRFSYKQKAHAKYSHPKEYAERPTSRGYFYNATYENARTLIHNVKENALPFKLAFAPEDTDLTADELDELSHKYEDFFDDYPTLLFTRNHISDRDGTLKVRPVYAVDDLFLIIESMLTFPLLIQARKPSCCIMYGLETIRGSNAYIDSLSRSFTTYFTIDWSGYDQRLPRIITDMYYVDFLRRLIVISHGYQPTYEYPNYPDLDEHKLYKKMDNLLHFLHLWYNNMTFLSVDGYAYYRLFAGVPSGLFNTQYLDSFGNLYLLIDGMIEFGFTDPEIKDIILFVLGDDNSGMTHWNIAKLHEFITFLEDYCLRRYNMVLSKTKSVITEFRSKIETLGYQCNHGKPRREIGKLVAQLCYPEHRIKYRTMSARAIGLAYASSGQDETFHSFCKDMYTIFSPFYNPDPRDILNLQRNVFRSMEDAVPEFDISELPPFPSIHEIRLLVSHYAGPLAYAPKWNFAHFINGPDVIPHSETVPLTMYQYQLAHDITPRVAPTLRTG